MYRQVKFTDKFEDSPIPTHPIGGIGIFEDDKLIGVICGECGGYIEADDIQQYEVMEWIDISDAIIGED